jgi:hypothetical protein
MLLTNEASHNHRNTLDLRGAQVDAVVTGDVIERCRNEGGALPLRENMSRNDGLLRR